MYNTVCMYYRYLPIYLCFTHLLHFTVAHNSVYRMFHQILNTSTKWQPFCIFASSPIFFPPHVRKSSSSWEDKLWWWRQRTDVKHDAIIFLSSSLFQSTCICQPGVLFCYVSTFPLKRYIPVSNRRRCLWIPMWEHEADDFYYNSVSPSLRLSVSHTSNGTPHMFAHSLTLQNFLTFGSHFIAFLFSWFLTEKVYSSVRNILCVKFGITLHWNINVVQHTGHVMHHQFNIQQLYALPTLYLCVLYLSENKQRLVPLTA